MHYNWNRNVEATRAVLGNSRVSVLTFQSMDVLEHILAGKTYTVDPTKCRESQDYRPDMRDGLYPIYVLCPIEFGPGFISFTLNDLLSGAFLFRASNEMSINRDELSKRPLLEISVRNIDLHRATVHNSASEVYVTHKIEPEQLIRWYDIKWGDEMDDDDDSWFYPYITVHSKGTEPVTYKSSKYYEEHCNIFISKPVKFI